MSRHVTAFYDLMFNQGKPAEAIRKYAGASHTQHNPRVAGGTAPFVAYFDVFSRSNNSSPITFC